MTDDEIVGFGGYGLSLSFEQESPHPHPMWTDLDISDTPTWAGWKKTKSSNSAKRQQKAKEFLKSWLTHQEYEDLQDGKLIIPSKIFPDRTYKLQGLASQMIEVYTSGILDHKLCVVAKDPRFENDDTVLAKILLLKTNEEQFLKIAEKHPSDSGFGRNLTYIAASGFGNNSTFTSNLAENTDSLTITWDLGGEITLRAESTIQPGQLVTINEMGGVVPYTTNSLKLRSRHNDNN